VEPKVKIVTDSTAYLLPEVVTKYDIRIVPLKVHFGADVYTEGVDITSEEFYHRLTEGGGFPTTSQPSLGDFYQVYTELAESGHPILSLHISSKLSGTVDVALAAKSELPEARIEVVDSRSIPMGMLITPAAEAAEKGLTLSKIKAAIDRLNVSIESVGAFETLEYVRKGGRIGAARSLVGTLLRIKPVLTFQNGEVKVLARPRTMTRAIDYVLRYMDKRVKGGASLHGWITHSHVLETAVALQQKLQDRFNWTELRCFELGPVLGTHVGPGFIGIGFYSDEDWQLG
jgi:DegV family protein with EDD domain